MKANLISPMQHVLMLANGRRTAAGEDIDPHPVVKLHAPSHNFVWLLTELDPDDPDIAFGLCDLGIGFPELGSVRLSEISSPEVMARAPVSQDLAFQGDKPLSIYANEARQAGAINA